MGFTVLQTIDNPNFKAWAVTATLDADTSTTIAHGFVDDAGNAVVPQMVWNEKQSTNVARWTAQVSGATDILVGKNTDAGSGIPGVNCIVYAMRPHTIMR